MKQSRLFQFLLPFIIILIPWVYLGIIWNDLPPTIATDFGINGMPDEYGPKRKILVAPLIISVVSICLYFLVSNLHKAGPKRKYAKATLAILFKIALVIIMLLSGAMLFIINWILHGKIANLSFLFSLMSLFIAYIGNLMYSIKPNYIAGFRLPWTLKNEDNWRRTHHLASKIWFFGGIALSVISLLVNSKFVIVVFICVLLALSIIPGLYSYKIHKDSLRKTV